MRHFNAARGILCSHLVGPILGSKAAEEIYPAGIQVEDSGEGGLCMFFSVGQATEVGERLST